MVELPPEEEEEEEEEGAGGDELAGIERMMATRAPYGDVVAALDNLAVPDDELAVASVAHTRLSAASMYERPDDELTRAIERYLEAERVPWRRLSAVLAACSDSPELFRRHVDPLLAEVDAIDEADDALIQVRAAARKVQHRLFGQ